MAGTIKIDPEDLAQKLATVRGIKEAVDAAGKALFDHTLIPDPYDGQLRAKIVPIGDEAWHLAKDRVERLEEMVERVERVIQAFKDTDQEVWARCDAGRDVAAYYALLGRELPPPPDWLENGSLPPWLTEGLSPEEQQALLARAREYWAYLLARDANGEPTDPAVLHETLKVLLLASMGISIDGMYAEHTTLAHDFAKGKVGLWKQHNRDPEDPGVPAQYLNARKLAGMSYPDAYHVNLCGELAVMAALGIEIDEGFAIFKDIDGYELQLNERGEEEYKSIPATAILLQNMTTSGFTLSNFVAAATQGSWEASFTSGNTFDGLAEEVAKGSKVVALVNIDGAQNGQLTSKDLSADPIAHWVTVLDVVELDDGQSLVKVYNPYMNREEFYSGATFQEAWSETRGNVGKDSLVVAEAATP